MRAQVRSPGRAGRATDRETGPERPPAERVLALQRSAGNQAVCRTLGRARGRSLQRVWDADAQDCIKTVESHAADLTGLDALRPLLEAYGQLSADQIRERLDLLPRITATIEIVAKDSGLAGVDPNGKTAEAPRRLALDNLRRAASAENTAAREHVDAVRYKTQKAATDKAFTGGVPQYLNISPRPGTKDALSTGAPPYPESVPLDQQYRVGVPDTDKEDLDITVSGTGGVIDLLVVSGGHGGVGNLFEQKGVAEHFGVDWWLRQAEKLAKQNVRAKLILLDACLTASMVPAFLPLLTGDGKIIGFVHSIPQFTMTPEIWAEALKDRSALATVIEARLQELAKTHAQTRGGALAGTLSVAIYHADKASLHYDDAAVSDEVVLKLDPKEKGELGQMRAALDNQKGKAMKGYAPSLDSAKETGAVVDKSRTVVSRTDLLQWYDEDGDLLVDAKIIDGCIVRNPVDFSKAWKLVDVTATDAAVVPV